MADRLNKLAERIRRCRICVETPTSKPLPHEPNPVLQVGPTAKILIAGQAPGTRVHASSKPFTDPSGVRLRAWMGVDEQIFYDQTHIAILPMGFCFPGLDAKGGDLPPRRECAPTWRQQVMDLMPALQLILTIGQYAQGWHLGSARKKNLSKTVANWQTYLDTCSPAVIPMPHPSWRNNRWLKNNPWFEKELVPILQSQVKQVLR
ncbi:MAG: uracil-DNA glycosylase family protein [Hyphomicrobiales bacterium]